MSFIKLTSAIPALIKPGATVSIPVNQEINVPEWAVGKFFVRLCYGEKGLTPPDSVFRPGFTGKPKKGIVLINNGPNEIIIRKDDELGELYFLALAIPPRAAFNIELTDEDSELAKDLREKHTHTHKE